MATVGPGAVQDIATDIRPSLEGASEFEYVTILNPLSDDFAVRVAIDVPVNAPFNIGKDMSGKTSQTTLTERDAAQTYGLSLKNPDFAGKKHLFNDTVIKAGQTINLKGSEAQVAVRQLVNEILQREGKTRLQSDPTLRQEVENRIIIARGSIQDLMDGNSIRTIQQQTAEVISRSNEVNDEPAFPELRSQEDSNPASSGEAEVAPFADSLSEGPRRVGRPKKADS